MEAGGAVHDEEHHAVVGPRMWMLWEASFLDGQDATHSVTLLRTLMTIRVAVALL